MNPSLIFEAGRVAASRGWAAPSVIRLDDLPGLNPTGDPVLVVASASTVDVVAAQAVAALAGVGRDITLVTDAPLPCSVQQWLPATSIHVLGSALSRRGERLEGALPIADPEHPQGTDNGPYDPVDSAPGDVPGVPGGDAAAGDGAEDSGWMCHFESATAVESLQPALSGWVATAWNQYVLQRDLKIMDQGTRDGVSAGAWALDERLPAAVWFQPTRSVGTGAEFLLIGSTIAVASDPGTPIEVPDSWWQRGFADHVVSWCEQPEASALHNRVFAFGQPVQPLGPRYQPDECFPDLPGGAISRVLATEDGQKMLGVPVAGHPRWVDNGPGSRSITFIYKIEAAHQYEQLESSWSHAIDSLVRIQRLLTHPDSDLDGRRDPVLTAPLEVFLRGSGISAAGAVAGRLRDALDDPDLPRKAQVMSQVWVVTNDQPGGNSSAGPARPG